MARTIKIAVAGNPNCGKTTLFNALTGSRQRVGNWPGVTVDKKTGNFVASGRSVDVVDLPGIYSLSSSSIDEEIASKFILTEKPDLIVNIVDAANLERNLYLTAELIETKTPMIVVLNMMDMARKKNIGIRAQELKRILGCDVIATVAHKGEGIEELKKQIVFVSENPIVSDTKINFSKEVEQAIGRVEMALSKTRLYGENVRYLAIKALEENKRPLSDDDQNRKCVEDVLRTERQNIFKATFEDPDILIANARYDFIRTVCHKVLEQKNIIKENLSDYLDKIFLNRFLGIPIFLAAMYFTFWVTINFGGCFIDFFDQAFGTIFVDGFRLVLEKTNSPVVLTTLLAEGVGGGIQTVATFIPPIFFMFFCLAILEDSGYMARAAFVMDRFMRWIGLSGKAFVPLLVGFGCNVPAIMATRTLENERDRVLTIMMNPFMSCGARLPVYALFAAAFFPTNGGIVIYALYLTGIILAILTGLMLKKTVLQGRPAPFILELPPYHIPTLRGVLTHAWTRLKAFSFRAGKAILLVVVILSFLNSIGTDGTFGNNNSEKSVLSKIGKSVVTIFKPMGMRDDNWPAAVGIFTGIFAKEAVVGTLDAIYAQIDAEEKTDEEGAEEEKEFSILNGLKDAVLTIPENLSELKLPFSLAGLIGADIDAAKEDLEVGDETYSAIRKRFDGQAGAFAYLLMILLYMPCVAAISAVYRELNMGWTVFAAVYLSVLAWITSTLFYQIARFSEHPESSLGWILFCVGILTIFVLVLRKISVRKHLSEYVPPSKCGNGKCGGCCC